MRALVAATLAAGCTALVASAGAMAPEADSPQALIQIDAVASDARGRIIENLSAADFDILVDGAAQPIDGVRFVRAGAGDRPADALPPILSRADEQAAALEDGTRLFAIFLDEYHVTEGPGVVRAREVIARFVAQTLTPRDLIVVVKPLDSLLTLQLTRDLNAVARAIAGFEGRKAQYDARNEFERSLIAGTPARIEAVRTQIAISALNALATHLGTFGAARKTIIVVSEGFARSPRRRGDEALPSLDTAIRTANRAQVSIYPYDPTGTTGASTDAASPSRATLRALAAETDGQAIVDDPDPAARLARLVADTDAYYLIAFRPPTLVADGRFHPVEVRVRRPDAQVRARKGYWAPSPDDVLRARLLALGREPGEPKPPPGPPRHISPLIRPWFGIARGQSGQTEVSFVWEPAGRVPGDRTRLASAAKLTLQVFRPDGSALFEGAIRASGAPGVEPGGDPARASFQTPPGRLRLRMAIEDANARLVDTDVRDLVVGPMTAPVVIGTPEVFRARNARDFRAIAADPGAVPVAAREFSRAERLLIRVPAYAPDGAPAMSARLASRQGTAMRDLGVGPGPEPDSFQIDLPLAGLAAGEYTVKLAARGPAGDAADELLFRVTP